MTRGDAALVALLPEAQHVPNGVPPANRVADAERALRIATELLGDVLLPDGIRVSPLGPGWSDDVDLHVRAWPDPTTLQAAGWVPLGPLLRRLGSDGEGRWAVMEGGRVLAAIDLHRTPAPDPVSSVLDRCRRRREVRLREVLEFRVLARTGKRLPEGHPIVAVAADVEASLGGDELERWATGQHRSCPAVLPTEDWRPARAGGRMSAGDLRRRLGRVRARLRPRLVVAVSGVDGSGKSSLCGRVAAGLKQAGVPATVVWTRPGMGLEAFRRPAAAVKRFLGEPPEPEMRRIAAGQAPASPTRRGLLGSLWALVVVAVFLIDVWRRHLRARGVVLYDRHLVDALVTLDVLYRPVPLGLHRRLVRLLLPRAAMTCYLDVPPVTALSRKPGDLFSEAVLARQLASYDHWLAEVTDLEVLDATGQPDALVSHLLRRVAAAGAGKP